MREKREINDATNQSYDKVFPMRSVSSSLFLFGFFPQAPSGLLRCPHLYGKKY